MPTQFYWHRWWKQDGCQYGKSETVINRFRILWACASSMYCWLFLGLVCHLEVHLESCHLLCKIGSLKQDLITIALCIYVIPIIITFPKCKRYFRFMHDILGWVHTLAFLPAYTELPFGEQWHGWSSMHVFCTFQSRVP